MRESADIDDPKAAALFSHRRQRRILLALIEQDRSLSDLARLTETPLNLLHHYLRRFMGLSLVVITRAETRAGAPIKFYRATARRFFVPAELMATAPSHELNAHLRQTLDRSLSSTIQGVTYSCENGHSRIRVVKASDRSTVTTELWLELGLTRDEAQSLSSDLRSLLKEYEARSRDSNPRYIIHAALGAG